MEINMELLNHAVINQLDGDLAGQDYDALDEMLQALMKDEKNVDILHNYLGDTAQKNLKEGWTTKNW
jgi:hypothetical protein